jgi:hypothetical protein
MSRLPSNLRLKLGAHVRVVDYSSARRSLSAPR